MTLSSKSTFVALIAGLAGSAACTVGEVSGELDVTRSSDAELAGTYDSTAGVHLTFEVARGAQGATARVSGETEGALLRVERGDASEPAVWIGAVPLAEASED